VEHVKRYTTVGMSVDQGKTSNLNAIAVIAELTGQSLADIGNTPFRPPFVPVTLSTIAGGRRGRFYRPERRLPTHPWQVANRACLEDYGGWQRPACYRHEGESEVEAVTREMRTVRTACGLFEASPLGKLLVRGADAAEFLHRIYANTMRTLEPGRVRYGLMLNERGIIIDDGVCARLSADQFWVNTTSAGAARIAGWMEEWRQCEWPHLDVTVTDVTSGWATFGVAGPRAREVLRRLPGTFDLSSAAFPHMHVRDGEIAGLPARILRVSFTGEVSFEVSVPADAGAWLWSELLRVGATLGLAPYGLEALQNLRIEKGYLHVGSDTDGTTVPADVGFGGAIAKKQGDFVGRRALSLPENVRADRLQLVGLRCTTNPATFVAGAHLAAHDSHAPAGRSEGYVTSACASPTLGAHVGLGLLSGGSARRGETVLVVHGGQRGTAEVVPPAHYDPHGERLND
jgi:sarcosine oxidase subunit alpha